MNKQQFFGALGAILATCSNSPADDVAAKLEALIREFRSNADQGPVLDGYTIAQDILSQLEDIESGWVSDLRLKSGFEQMDRISGGFGRGHVDVIAALTGVGKSIFAGNLAINFAMQGYTTLIDNQEMKVDDYMRRIIAKHTQSATLGWSGRGELPSHQLRDIVRESKQTFERIRIGSPDQMSDMASIRGQIEKHPADVVIIDYIQCLESGVDERSPETYKLKALMNDCDRLADKHSCLVIVLAQLKQEYEALQKKRGPSVYDVADSKWIGKKGHRVWVLTKHVNTHDGELQRLSLVKSRYSKSEKFIVMNSIPRMGTYEELHGVHDLDNWRHVNPIANAEAKDEGA